MGIISWIKAVWNKLFRREIEKRFDADILLSGKMESAIEKFYNITSGHPEWEDVEDDIESINFAGFIDDVTAGLVTLDIGINMPDTPRGKMLKKTADYIRQVITDKVSEALGNVGIMFKPNGENMDYVEPGNYAPTEADSNGNITGCVFQTQTKKGDYIYTRLEWHRYETRRGEGGEETKVYRVSNYAYKSKSTTSIGDPCNLSEVKEWADIEPEMESEFIDHPLFAYFRNPAPNRIDRTSPLGVPIWHNAMKELKDLDVAWGRKSGEVQDSKHVTFLPQTVINYADQHNVKLPRWVAGVEMGAGVNDDNNIHEHVSTLLTEQRIADINSILAMISTKCGFSQGMFVLDEKTGMMTATQVDADDQETIRTIKNIRDQLKNSIIEALYACNEFIDFTTGVPREPWAADFETFRAEVKDLLDFGNIQYNYNEDKAQHWQYVQQGKYPLWRYYVEFEGMSEEEAREVVADAKSENEPKEPGLFGEE